jgi:hypothetical protein
MHSNLLHRIFVVAVATLACVGFVHAAQAQTASTQAADSDRLVNAPRLPMLLLTDFRSDAGNDPMIKCLIGERSYWFSIDTAMNFSVLKRSVQQEAGLETDNHPDFDVANLDESDRPIPDRRQSVKGESPVHRPKHNHPLFAFTWPMTISRVFDGERRPQCRGHRRADFCAGSRCCSTTTNGNCG